jgi:hypothetical protein
MCVRAGKDAHTVDDDERERERESRPHLCGGTFFQELNLGFPSTQYYSYIQISDVITESLRGLLFSECNIARTAKVNLSAYQC